jgi:hypothetical protein
MIFSHHHPRFSDEAIFYLLTTKPSRNLPFPILISNHTLPSQPNPAHQYAPGYLHVASFKTTKKTY